MRRPMPPVSLLDDLSGDQFIPAPEIVQWARSTLIDEGAALANLEHLHLRNADIGALWTNVANAKNGRAVVGQCELGDPMLWGSGPRQRPAFRLNNGLG